MSRTGYLIEVYMDANPYSETYGQERTERILDTEECKTQQPANYVLVYTYCEMNSNGSYTGNSVKVYEDVEPLSPTYGQQMEEVVADQVLCPPDSAEADWQQIDQYCEQIAYQPSGKLGNSGYMVTLYRDVNEYSPTYNQTREDKTQDLTHCTPPSTEDVWVIISETCHLVDGLKDGTKDVVRVNTNEYSPNYNDGQSETVNVEDLTMCPLDEQSPVWTETSYVCVLDDGYRTGYVTVTEEDTNQQSASYGQTRTRTYQDEERCPYQPKPQPVALKWRVVNNRSASTDAITHITLHFNGNYDIDILGSGISPAGGRHQGTVNLPASLTSTGLVLESVELSPNTSLPRLFQTQQTPSPFVWSDTSGSAVLTVTLWDGDGTGPMWSEVSYTCETAGGYRTGASIVVEEDINTESGTYGQQRTRTIENDSRCPAQTDASWVETSWSCEKESGYNTGNVISVQTDQNPNSSSYGSTRTRIISDTERCPIDTTAHWVEVSYVCEQVEGKYNTGSIVITERDNNPGSDTYNTTRTRTETGDARCVRNENPDWSEESYVCEQASTDPNWEVTGYTCETSDGYNTGNKIVTETDTNPNSLTYNQTRTSIVEDTTACPVVDRTPDWREISYTCEQDDDGNTGTAIVVEQDMNQYSPTYGQQRTVSELDTERCPLPIPSGYKLRTTDSNGIVTEIPCDSTNILNRTEVDRNCVTAEIGECVTTLGNRAFQDCTYMTSVIVPSTITYFGESTFLGCSSLQSVTLPNGITNLGENTFQSCTSLSNITIPDSVMYMGQSIFSGCTSLLSINIPETTGGIGNYAFKGCTSLTSVTVNRTTPPTLGSGAFDNTNDCPIYVPSGKVYTYKSATGWKKYKSRIKAIPNS